MLLWIKIINFSFFFLKNLLFSSSVLDTIVPGLQTMVLTIFSPKKFLISTAAPLLITLAMMGKWACANTFYR